MPSVVDSCFSFHIVHICEYDSHGTLDLIVKKSCDMKIDELLMAHGPNAESGACIEQN